MQSAIYFLNVSLNSSKFSSNTLAENLSKGLEKLCLQEAYSFSTVFLISAIISKYIF